HNHSATSLSVSVPRILKAMEAVKLEITRTGNQNHKFKTSISTNR
ncbi:MAG: hypothetical protein RL672_123, partial [Actinomycetota bacterium]